MTELLTAAQMRAMETAAIESGEVTGLELMERAGAGVVEAVIEEWPELGQGAHRAVVLCGPGNNGGDGFVVARLLKERGWAVEVFLYGDAEKLPPDARVNYARWAEMGEVAALTAETFGERSLATGAEIVVDAVFGTGLSRQVDLPLVALSPTPETGATHKLVAVDIPSGLCADSGRQIVGDALDLGGIAAPADLTVTFHALKHGHVLADGSNCAGRMVVKGIGLPGRPRPRVGVKPPPEGAVGGCPAVPPGEVVGLVDRPDARLGKSGDHKFSHGHALILSGGPGRTGAARLAARGALRIGAGLVTLGVPPSAQMEVASQITALMLTRVADADGLAEVLTDARINALCLGPGMGLERASALVPVTLTARRATVLDADALSAFQDDPHRLFEMLHENCVLTPHGGEFARLFPDIAEKLSAPAIQGPAFSKVDATREAAKRAGCVVLFKGPDTVIADPSGRCAINAAVYDREAPWLATAGSGDVLAGFITGLLARGFTPMQAAETAAWLHVECARSFGPGLIAEDLPDELPRVFQALDF